MFASRGVSRWWVVVGPCLVVAAGFGPGGVPTVAQDVAIDFDATGPTADDQLSDFFDFLGFDNCVGPDPCWNIAPNEINADDGSNALHTFSDGGQLENWFSRVAILKEEVFTGENVEIAVDVTYDSRSDANDHAGIYFRFNGDSDVPLENSYYFLRIDACNEDRGDDSSITLHRVKDGAQQSVVGATNDPFKVCMGDAARVSVKAVGNLIFVAINGEPVGNMNPVVDSSPLLGDGRVGVGQNTNPAFFDNIAVSRVVVPCNIVRSVSQSTYLPGDTIDVTLSVKDLEGETTIVESVPEGFTIVDAGAGVVDANTITFVSAENAELAYSVMGEACGSATFSAAATGPQCVGVGDSTISCGIQPSGALSHMLQIGPVDPGRNTGAQGCSDDGRLGTTDYLLNADGSAGESSLLVGLGDTVTPDFGGMADAAGVKDTVNQDINPDRATGVLTVWLADADSEGRINFNDPDNLGNPVDDYIIYSLVYLDNHTGGCLEAILEIGSDDAVKVLVNGEVVHVNNVCRGVQGYGAGDMVPVLLAPGANVVLTAVVERGGGTDVRVVVRDTSGAPLTDGSVTASFTPPAEFPTPPAASVTRTIPAGVYRPGDIVDVTLDATGVTGETSVTEILPTGWNVVDSGGGEVTSPVQVGTDFDTGAPRNEAELVAIFDFYGHDATVGASGWRIEPNAQNPDNGTNALHITSDGEQLENYFSRVAIAKGEIFSAQDVEFSLDITWDDMGGDANDQAGAYVRFNGDSDVPLENSYYYVRIDACNADRSNASNVIIHRVKDGEHEELINSEDDPIKVCEGDTARLTVRAVGSEIWVSINGDPVSNMSPFVDPDPLLGAGRVGVGENTNPAYFDNMVATEIGGQTIAFTLAADGTASYTLATPDASPDSVSIRGLISDAGGGCKLVGGDSTIQFFECGPGPDAEEAEYIGGIAFNSRQIECEVMNVPGSTYTLLHHSSPASVAYSADRGFGYEVLYPENSPYGARGGYGVYGPFDDSPNNRGQFPDGCPEDLYDSFIGAKDFLTPCQGDENDPCDDDVEGVVFRVDVPNGRYRFVAAVGSADNRHTSRILAEDGGSGPPDQVGRHVVLVNGYNQAEHCPGTFARVGFDGKVPPFANGPQFIDMDENGLITDGCPNSPALFVTQGYIRIHQLQARTANGACGNSDANGGNMVVLELWRLPTASAQIAGDCDQSGAQDVSDLLCYVGTLFPGFDLLNRTAPPSPCSTEAGSVAVLDIDGDGALATADLVSFAHYLFGGGAPPAQGAGCFAIAEGDCAGNAGCQ